MTKAPIPGTVPIPNATNSKTQFAYVANSPFVDPQTGMLSNSGQKLLNQQILPALKTANGVTSFSFVDANGVEGLVTDSNGAIGLEIDLTNISPSEINCSGTITAEAFIGDGSGLTGIPGSAIDLVIPPAYLSINQTNHQFQTGQAVYFNGTSWALALANNAGTLGIGIVSYVDANDFNLYQTGEISGLSSLVTGQYYFVSDTTPGLLTTTQPTSTSSFSNPLLQALTTTTGLVLPYRPSAIFSNNFAPDYDFLLDCEPMSPSMTYTATWNGSYVTNESWFTTGTVLFKSINYTLVSNYLTGEVRKLFASDGITVIAQSTISYTYQGNQILSSTYIRNI